MLIRTSNLKVFSKVTAFAYSSLLLLFSTQPWELKASAQASWWSRAREVTKNAKRAACAAAPNSKFNKNLQIKILCL